MLGNGVRIAEAIVNIKARTQPARDEIDKLGEKMDKLRAKIAAVTFSKGIGLSAVLDGMDSLVYKMGKLARETKVFTDDATRRFDRLGAVMRGAGHNLNNFLNPSRVITGIGGVDRAIQRIHTSLRNITLSRFNIGNAIGTLLTGYGTELSRVFAMFGRMNPMQNLFVSMMRSSTFFRSLPLGFRYAVESMARDADNAFGRIGVIFRAMSINPNTGGFIARINTIHDAINRLFGNGTVSRFGNYATAVTGFFNNVRTRFVSSSASLTIAISSMGARVALAARHFGIAGLMLVGSMRAAGNIGTVPIAALTRFFTAVITHAPIFSSAASVINRGVFHVTSAIGSILGGIGSGAGAIIRGIGEAFQFAAGAARVLGVALSVAAGAFRLLTGFIGMVLSGLKTLWNMFHAVASAIASFVEAVASAIFQVIGVVLKAAGVAAAVVTGLAVAAVKKAADIQVAYQELGRIASLAGQDVLKLRDAIVSIGTTSPGTGSIKDLFELASFGARMGIGEGLEGTLKVKALEDFTKSIARVRMALTDMPTEEAATYIVRILRVFGLGPEYIDNFASALVKLDNSSTATGRDILDLTRRLSGVLSTLGAMPYEVMGLAAAMRDAGVEVEVGGTAMSQLFIKTAYKTREYARALKIPFQELEHAINTKPIEALKMVLQAIGKFSPVDQLRVLSKMQLQGRQTSSVILQMANNWKLIDGFMSEGAEEWRSQNSLIEAANVRSRQFYSILEQSTNKLTALAAKIGDMLMPAAIAMVEFFGTALDAASEFFEANKEQISSWVSVVEGGVTTARQHLITGLAPFYDYLNEKWQEFMGQMSNAWSGFWSWLKENWFSISQWIGETMMTAFDRAIGHLIDKMPLIGKAVQSAFSGFFTVVNAAAKFIDDQQNYEAKAGDVSAGGLTKRAGNIAMSGIGGIINLPARLLAMGGAPGNWGNVMKPVSDYFGSFLRNKNQTPPGSLLPPAPKGDVNAPFPKFPEIAKPEWFRDMADPKKVQEAKEKAAELAAREYEDGVKQVVERLLSNAAKRDSIAADYWNRGNKIMYDAQKAHAEKERELAGKLSSGEYSMDVAKQFFGGVLKGAPTGEANVAGLPKGFVPQPAAISALGGGAFADIIKFTQETAKWHAMQAALAKQGLDNETLLQNQKEEASRKATSSLQEYDKTLHRIAEAAKERQFLDENLNRITAGFPALTKKQYEEKRKRMGLDESQTNKENPMLKRLANDRVGSMQEAAKLEKEAKKDLAAGNLGAYREKLKLAREFRTTHVSKEAAARMQRKSLIGDKSRTQIISRRTKLKKAQISRVNDATDRMLKSISGLNIGTIDARAKMIKDKGGSVETEAGAMKLAQQIMADFKKGDSTTVSNLLNYFGDESNMLEKIAMLLRETPEETQAREKEHMRKGGYGVFDPLSDEMLNMHSKSAGDFTGLVEFSRKLQSSALAKEDIPKKQLKVLEQIAENTGAENPANMQINNFGGAVAQ